MDRREEDEVCLVKQAVRGNEKAFEALMEQYKTYLYRVAFGHCRNEENALDAVQECVTLAYLHIRKVHSPQYFGTWLTKILINVIRRQQKKSIPSADTSLEELQIAAKEKGVSPEERMDLYRAIDRLPENYRTIIILKYFNDVRISEIARIMDLPEGSVKGFLHRARGLLREDLEGGRS